MPRASAPDWPLIERENEGLTVRTTRDLGEGWCSRAYLVNEELVVKCPKRAGDWLELEREVSFLQWAGDKLPVPVPRYVRVARHSPAAPHGYAVYRYVAGAPLNLETLSPEQRADAAQRIAGFLQRLHSLSPRDEVAGIPEATDRRKDAEACLARATIDILPTLTKRDADRLRKRFDAFLDMAEPCSRDPVVLHADFSREHILHVDGIVSGVIDFGDVSWGDADYDFHYLMMDFGESFVMDVAHRYGHANLDRLLIAIRYYALADQIETVLDESGLALPGQADAARRRVIELLRFPDAGR